MDVTNIYAIPTWGLWAFALAVLGGLAALAVAVWRRRAQGWALALVPVAGVAAFGAATAPANMMTLSVALASTGLAVVLLLTGALGLAPTSGDDDDRRR